MSGRDDFGARRQAARERLDALEGARGGNPKDRSNWFEAVYETAGRDVANVPWADAAPKQALLDWLADHPGEGRTALDIGCGIGDNAEALAAAGYRTTAFDLAPAAIDWARERFPDSAVAYHTADLFAPPAEWRRAFDLVHECYTVQPLSGDMRANAFVAVAEFVAPGGRLVAITRTRPDDTPADGPPWPLSPAELKLFETDGLVLEDRFDYRIERPDGRVIPHARLILRRA